MKILGYSERGAVNSLFYEIGYSRRAESLLEKLLAYARIPFLEGRSICISNAEILVEQSFSDFGDADAVILMENGSSSASMFVEAKVKPFQRAQWSIDEEFRRFTAETGSRVSSSNLFTEFYHKARLVHGLRDKGIIALQAGVPFPRRSSKPIRKIGRNQVVLRAAKKLEAFLDETYFLALIPEDPVRAGQFFGEFWESWPDGFGGCEPTNFGYLCWSQVEAFCADNGLENTLRVLAFNEGQIYERPRNRSQESLSHVHLSRFGEAQGQESSPLSY